MSADLVYPVPAGALPYTELTWLDSDGDIIDFSGGAYTFEVRVGKPGKPALIEQAIGITGDSVAPNVVVAWAATSLDDLLKPGTYNLQVEATRVSDSKRRYLVATLEVENKEVEAK